MEGGELFDRIQRKGHFTERGQLEERGGGWGELVIDDVRDG